MTEQIKNFIARTGMRFNNRLNSDEVIKESEKQWELIAKDLDVCDTSVVMVFGARCGKSSLLRHLVNSYIADSKAAAYYMDCNPGQSDLTSGGIVSAHVIRHEDAPMTSPPYLNISQHECVMQSCAGGTNAAINPRLYVENCRFVYESLVKYKKDNDLPAPTFINTMGFLRREGLDILKHLIYIMKPTDLIVLNVENDSSKTIYTNLSPKFASMIRKPYYIDDLDVSSGDALDYEYRTYNLTFEFQDSSVETKKNRAANQLAYLAPVMELPDLPLIEQKEKYLYFDKILIYCVPFIEEMILDFLVHSWVHLVKLRHKHYPMKGQDNEYCKILEEFHENTLHGCGIVSRIDLDNRRICIITPLSQEMLDNSVDCLIKPVFMEPPRCDMIF